MSNSKTYFAHGNINHNGTDYRSGDEITVTEKEAEALLRIGVISEEAPEAPAEPKQPERIQSAKDKEEARKAKGEKTQDQKDAERSDDSDSDESGGEQPEGDEFDNMSAAEWKDACEAAGLSKSGSKAEMIERLRTNQGADAGDAGDDISADL